MPTYLCYLTKACLMYFLAGAQSCINILFLASSLDREDMASNSFGLPVPFPLKYSLAATLFIVATALIIVARYVSKVFFLHWEKNLVALIRNLVDSTSMSIGEWTNSFRNYQMSMINFFLLRGCRSPVLPIKCYISFLSEIFLLVA